MPLRNLRSHPWPEILILLLALLLRVWALDIKPPHFDEGINGWFADQMAHQGFYKYDPTNFHGPLHFYAVFVSQTLFGRNLWALRLPAVLASLACVWLALRFGRFIGRDAARWAALAMAVSPAMAFYGRYSIHESWLVLFSMLFAWGVFELWKSGSRSGIFAIAAGTAGMVLTKETYFIHIGCFALAVPCLLIWNRFVPARPAVPFAKRTWTPRDAILAAALAIVAILLFYSGFFLNWPGITGLYETYAAWFKTGVAEAGHEKTYYQIGPLNYYYLWLLARYEWPALLGLAACFRFLWPSSPFVRYLAIYGAGSLIAYSIIPYKTPWLVISFLWPFFFTLGALIEEFSRFRAVLAAAAVLLIASLSASVRLNFREFTNASEPYVYVQTFEEIENLTGPLLEAARRDPRAFHMNGQFMLDSYYPLPWILGDFTSVGYFNEARWPARIDGDFIAAEVSKAGRVERSMKEAYYRREFRLRDGQEDCVAWFRAEPFRSILGGEPEIKPQRRR